MLSGSFPAPGIAASAAHSAQAARRSLAASWLLALRTAVGRYMQPLVRLAGPGVALEILLEGRIFGAGGAKAKRLLTQIARRRRQLALITMCCPPA